MTKFNWRIMRIASRSVGCALVFALVGAVGVYAEDNGRSEVNHGQGIQADGRGDHARQVPPRATTNGSVTTGNGINYNGGPVLHSIHVYYIWYGNWGQDPAANAILTNFAQSIGGSPYFNINTAYGDSTGSNVPNVVTFKGSYSDPGSLGTSLTDSSIYTIVSSALASGTLGPADPNGVYFVLTAPGVADTSGFLTEFCGWHGPGTFNGTTVEYAFIGDAAGPSFGSCAVQSTSPNGDAGADAMASVIAHELEESATDPQINAWYDSSGNEVADKCAWTFGSTYTVNGAYANMNLGGLNYLIQQNWVNASGGYCGLSYVAAPDFSTSISPSSQSVSPGGTTATYTLTATPSSGFSGTISWTIAPPAGITATSTSLTGDSATFALTASACLAAGTYSVQITATSGTLTHSLTATLVVKAPTAPSFSLAITPGSQTVKRPSTGTMSVTYTLSVTPVGAFTSPVSFSVSGAITGISPSLSTTSVSGGSGTVMLTVTVSNSAKKVSRSLTVTAAGGVVTKQTTATISDH